MGPRSMSPDRGGTETEIACMGSYFQLPISLDKKEMTVLANTLIHIQFVLSLRFLLV